MNLFEWMKIAIVFAGLYAAITQIWQGVKMYRMKFASAWVHFGLGVMGLYWLWYYMRSALDAPVLNTHQIYVRGPLLLTIVLIGAAGAFAVRRLK